jgi:hypothetical protein
MANQIVISSGAKVRNLNGVLTGTTGVVNSLGINVANGIPQLDGSGKILVSQLPNSVMEYKGTWNAATNTPTLANGTGNQGDVYLCSTAGTVNFGAGAITFAVGDQVIYSGTIWQKAGGSTGTVTSLAITETGDALTITGSPITTSGTINIGFAGTSGQYVNGAGGLTTFPTLLSSVGLSMPSAFTVSNSPLTSNGTIAVTGAGTTAQYIRGDGSLATFPTTAQEAKRLITEVYNSTGATLTKGTVVYINGGQGNLPTITKAQANADNTSAQTYGVVQADITNNNNGFVVVAGSLMDIDTQAYTAGTQLYLSGTTAGAWTSTKPSAPIHLVYVGIVIRSHPTQGVVEVKIQNGYELDELHDVAITSVANTDGIFYNSSTFLWENKTIAEVLGYTPANDSLVVKLAGTQTITGAKTFSAGIAATTGSFSSYIDASYARLTNGIVLPQSGSRITSAGETTISVYNTNGILIGFPSSNVSGLLFNTSASNFYTFPNATGTVALTSDIPSVAGVYLPLAGGTMTGALNINTSGSTGLNVASDGVIFRSNTGVGSPRQIELSMGGGTSTYLDAKGYGASYNTDFGIRTYNSSGTWFNVFYGTSAGLVGIGTTAPLSKLHVIGTGTVVRFGEESASTGKQLLFGINSSNGTSEIQSVWQGTANTTLALNPAGGNLGIGTSTPSDILDVQKNQNATTNFYFRNTDTTNTSSRSILNVIAGNVSTTIQSIHNDHSYINATNNLYFQSSGNVKMLITSGGNVGIGTSSPSDKLSVAGRLNLFGLNQNSIWFNQNAGGTSTGYIVGRSFLSNDAQDFFIYDVAAASARMFISSSGYICVNTITPAGQFTINSNNSSNCSIVATNPNNTSVPVIVAASLTTGSTSWYAYIAQSGNGSSVTTNTMFVYGNGNIVNTNGSYGTMSDISLKENIVDATPKLDNLLRLKVRNFNLIDDENKTKQIGFIAQEFEEVFPSMIDIDGKTGNKSIKTSVLVPMLVKAIQEQQAQIEELKAKIK